jgi:hypothetical protein
MLKIGAKKPLDKKTARFKITARKKRLEKKGFFIYYSFETEKSLIIKRT